MQKVIFLDIDGVLNSRKFLSISRGEFIDKLIIANGDDLTFMAEQLDPEAIARLNRIITVTGANVVVSSTWRLMWPLEKIVAALESRGFVGDVIGATDNFEREWGHVRRPRALEIADFADRHNVEHFVVVDDDPICDEGDSPDIVARLIRTTFDDGLTDEIADQMIEVLT